MERELALCSGVLEVSTLLYGEHRSGVQEYLILRHSSLVIYIDYGTAMPFNGGELIYVRSYSFGKLLEAFLTNI
jgi:hypothetical protein